MPFSMAEASLGNSTVVLGSESEFESWCFVILRQLGFRGAEVS